MTLALQAKQQDRPRDEAWLNEHYGHLDGRDLLEVMIKEVFPGRIALVSSFGSESAVLIDMVAQIDPSTPILFLNTGKLFGETLRYRDTLESRFGLTDIRTLKPDADEVREEDRNGLLWTRNLDACCDLRKTRPLDAALEGFDAWITGRKRFQTGTRAALPLIEESEGRIKVNPLANFSLEDLQRIANEKQLPRHPLVADGYLSIGCMPCTKRVEAGEDYRSGRWAGTDKTECGIHVAENI
ncbi:phosphoadenylyl-sulfate reductase [Emcibacter sp. SYSU 3D8]|uniref:phosphoadenylyl-sulfate reductase n=1 Tax=Emcibacter sp. SYSU 3D8 TaxID=3133969 RepID=UPI0031FF1D1C